MSSPIATEISIEIQAPLAQVWDALVNPDVIREYFFGTEAESSWKVGSPVLFKGTWEGTAYEDKGIVLKNNFEKEIQYTYWSSFSGTEDVPANYATITYLLASKGNVTTLTVKQSGYKTEEQKSHSEGNWKMVLENIKSILEKN